VSVLLLLAVLLSLLLPATATAQGKEDLKAVRGDNSVSFYMPREDQAPKSASHHSRCKHAPLLTALRPSRVHVSGR
jgi:hypothetical protein